jgi:hypothetical protein
MNLSAPSQVFFLIAVALVIIAIIGVLTVIPFVTKYAFWIAVVGFAVLAAGCLNKGM